MKRPTMTKGEALRAILMEAERSKRQPKPAEFRRLLRACTALGLTSDETLATCRLMGLCYATGAMANPDLDALAPWREDDTVCTSV
jgi:hypothetical protein